MKYQYLVTGNWADEATSHFLRRTALTCVIPAVLVDLERFSDLQGVTAYTPLIPGTQPTWEALILCNPAVDQSAGLLQKTQPLTAVIPFDREELVRESGLSKTPVSDQELVSALNSKYAIQIYQPTSNNPTT